MTTGRRKISETKTAGPITLTKRRPPTPDLSRLGSELVSKTPDRKGKGH